MKGINHCTFLGNLGSDADIKQTQSGSKVANFSIGCGYSVKDGQGGWKDKTEWVRIVCWTPSDWLCSQLKKGKPVHVTGRMQTRKWQDQHGNDKYSTEIVCNAGQVIPVQPYKGEHQSNVGNQQQQAAPAPQKQHFSEKPVDDDDIPFALLIGSGLAYALAQCFTHLQASGVLA